MERLITIAAITSKFFVEPRTQRMSAALSQHGYSIQILTWDRSCHCQKFEDHRDYQVHRLRLKAPTGTKGLIFWPLWWLGELVWLLSKKWDIVHAINFDTVVPAIIAAKLRRKAVIYEIFDVLEDSLRLPSLARRFCLLIDRFFMRMVDAMIIADDNVIAQIGGPPKDKKIVTVLNSPTEICDSSNYNEKRFAPFTIFYAGNVYQERFNGLKHIIKAIESLNDVRLVIAGWGLQSE